MSIWVPLARPHRAVPGAERRKAVKVVLNSKVHYALNGTAISRAASRRLLAPTLRVAILGASGSTKGRGLVEASSGAPKMGGRRDERAARWAPEGLDVATVENAKSARAVKAKLEDLASAGVDYVIIDTPPELEDRALVTAIFADLMLVPVTPSALDLWCSSSLLIRRPRKAMTGSARPRGLHERARRPSRNLRPGRPDSRRRPLRELIVREALDPRPAQAGHRVSLGPAPRPRTALGKAPQGVKR